MFTHFWEAQAVIWGSTALNSPPGALGRLFSFWAQSMLGRHISCLGEAQAVIRGSRPQNAPLWHRAFIVGLVTIVDIVSLVYLVGMVDLVGLVDMVSKCSRHSRQGRQSLAWDNKIFTLLCLLEQPVFHFLFIAFTISKQCLLNNRFCIWLQKMISEAHYKQTDKFLTE